jgi:predicted phosphodiesterase
MKKTVLIVMLLGSILISAQEKSGAELFFENIKRQCGKSFEGEVVAGNNDTFKDKKLVMHVRNCYEKIIRIPFFVGEDKSRTWVLTLENNRIKLKHDHRHEDGSEDKVTQYGGTSTNTGSGTVQIFPADQETFNVIPNAVANVWWITIDETTFTYNLRRIGSDRLFTVKFDLTKTVSTPSAPWGWND